MPGGRPTKYNEKLASHICKLRSEGKSLRAIARMPSMPAMSTIMKWLNQKLQFAEQYAKACEADADLAFDELVDLADKATAKNVQAVKLAIDTRKWVLSKRLPKKYGDRMGLELSGKDGEGIDFRVTFVDPDPEEDPEV